MRSTKGVGARSSVWLLASGVLALATGALADVPMLSHLPEKPGMKACYVEVPLGAEITSLLCLKDGLKSLSRWESQAEAERKWHTDASHGAFSLARQAYRNGHPAAAELFYGATLLSVYGVPHATSSPHKQALCKDATEAITAGCRIERCSVEGKEAEHAELFPEVARAYRTACVRSVPPVCTWDEKKPPVCGATFGAITREWSQYSRYVQALPRFPERAEQLMPVLEKWRTALEAYEKVVYPSMDAGRSGEEAQALGPVLAFGVEARKGFEAALLAVQEQANVGLPGPTRLSVGPLMAVWKNLASPGEASSLQALQARDTQLEAVRTAIRGLAR
ncbi:MAG: hypothetical protein SFV15_16290 [Polyangiaceae bacterium]|nr:hypothetical protein [Polyangiaceae bacterium]